MTRKGERILAWMAVVCYAAVIWTLSSISDFSPVTDELGWFERIPFSDKIVHATEYAIFAALLTNALSRGAIRKLSWRVAGLAVLIATLYGASDEIHQMFVPQRTPDVLDLLADATGSVVGAVGAPLILGALFFSRAAATDQTEKETQT